jgi:transcriptional regulator
VKLYIKCDSLLLKKALEGFLTNHVVSYAEAEIVICDKKVIANKPTLIVNHSKKADLKVPFTKAELYWALEECYMKMLEYEISITHPEQMRPFIQKLNKKHHTRIAKLAKKIHE